MNAQAGRHATANLHAGAFQFAEMPALRWLLKPFFGG